MGSYGIRALIALLLAVFLFLQSRGAAAQPHRQRSFQLGAAALLLLAVYNGSLTFDTTNGPLQIGLAIASMALFAGAIVSLVLSFSSGEMRGERQRIADAAREFREQREQQARKKGDPR